MNVLIPYDTDTTGTKNPYLFLLMRELAGINNVNRVMHGYGWLYEDVNADIVHLHWPELLVKSHLSDMSRDDLLKEENFKNVLNAIEKRKRRGSKVIATIHNETPHKDHSGRYDSYFSKIYDLCDGFIHMGGVSQELTEASFKQEVKGKHSFIIPHGNYAFFPNKMDQVESRKKLRLPQQGTVVMSFGAIRSKRELELGITACKRAKVKNLTYVIAGRLPDPYKSQPRHFLTRKMLYANMFNEKIRTYEMYISPENVQMFLNSADVLFIPRFNTLNSGNVALGFTFGKVVIGPDYGVIGETLKETGNPVFDPYNADSVSAAIEEAVELAVTGHGNKNKIYANKQMKWDDVAKKTFDAYEQLLNKQGD